MMQHDVWLRVVARAISRLLFVGRSVAGAFRRSRAMDDPLPPSGQGRTI